MIIVVGGIKGGTGKSTTAANLAVKRAENGFSVLLVDGDDQETTILWAQTRSDQKPDEKNLTTIKLSGKAARSEVVKLATNYDDVIIDVGGRDTTTQRAALTIADLMLIPLPPRGPDVWTLDKVSDLVEEVTTINPKLRVFAFINRADATGGDNETSALLIQETQGIELIPIKIGDRKAFPNAHTQGLSVTELKPKDFKAAEELEDLFSYIFSTNLVLKRNKDNVK